MAAINILNNKKILFFSVQTFNLEKEIIKKLEEFGSKVDYYDERPANNNFIKGIIRFKRSIYQYKIDKYYHSVLEVVKNKKYDFLFVNKGEVVPSFFLEKFKNINPKCIFVFYTWDSMENNIHAKEILKYFDKTFTFDPKDAREYQMNFRPLFYLDDYEKIKKNKGEFLHDLIFLGTAHSDRYIVSKQIVNWCNNVGLKTFTYYFMQGKLVYLFKRLYDKTFKEFDYKKLSFTSLTKEQIIQLYDKSKVILDINHPQQRGLTLRTFESIGAGKKLITTNKDIVNYSFYNPNNILVIDRKNIILDKKFFENDYQDISNELYLASSLNGWINTIFNTHQENIWKK